MLPVQIVYTNVYIYKWYLFDVLFMTDNLFLSKDM